MSKWNGEGLPPEGETVLANWCDGDEGAVGEPVEIRVYRDGKVWFKSGGKERVLSCRNVKFYPLKSEADRKRDELKESAYKDAALVWQATGQGVLDVVDKLIDAGYRKVTPLTDEQIIEYVGTCYSFSPPSLQARVIKAMKWARSRVLGEES